MVPTDWMIRSSTLTDSSTCQGVTSAWLWPVRIALYNRLGAGLAQLGDQR